MRDWSSDAAWRQIADSALWLVSGADGALKHRTSGYAPPLPAPDIHCRTGIREVHTRGGKRRRHYSHSASARACVLSFADGTLQLAGADFGHFRVRGAGQFTGVHGRIGRSSQRRGCLTSGIGVAQLRLASLVQGDWLSGLRSSHSGRHLITWCGRGRLTICLARPGWSVPVRGSDVPGPRRSRHPRHREIVGFSTTQPGSSGSWMMGRSGKRAGKCSLRKYGEWRRPAWRRARADRRVWRTHRQRLLTRPTARRAWRGGGRDPARARCSYPA